MRSQVSDAAVVSFGGLLMLLGVYFSYADRLALISVFVGAMVFLFGLYLDLVPGRKV